MLEKIMELKKLANMNLLKEIDPMEWVDHYQIDDDKVFKWNSDIMDILKTIDEKYVNQFFNVQKNVSIEHNLGDYAKLDNLKNSKKCLEDIIKDIESI